MVLVLTPAPFLWLRYSNLYLLVVLFADGLMLRVLWALLDEAAARKAGDGLKWVMIVGMIALACAGAPE